MTATAETRFVRFIHEETTALNDERYNEWLDLLTDDYDYTMPMPVLRDNPDQPRYSETSLLAWESIHSLRLRFKRLESDFAWADHPPAFVRRHVTSVRIADRQLARPDEVAVNSDVIAFRARAPEGAQVISAARHDVVRISGENLRLAKRTVFIDTYQPDLAQISLLF